jgi:hypothetical protein
MEVDGILECGGESFLNSKEVPKQERDMGEGLI